MISSHSRCTGSFGSWPITFTFSCSATLRHHLPDSLHVGKEFQIELPCRNYIGDLSINSKKIKDSSILSSVYFGPWLLWGRSEERWPAEGILFFGATGRFLAVENDRCLIAIIRPTLLHRSIYVAVAWFRAVGVDSSFQSLQAPRKLRDIVFLGRPKDCKAEMPVNNIQLRR